MMPSQHGCRKVSDLILPTICVLVLLGLPSSAANAEITMDGSMGPAGSLTGPNYLIGADLGQQRGQNLFHSFGQFNLLSSESATFSGPNTIANVIGRVTGGSPSSIDGLIRSEIPGANLFLLNPFGILFGPNASLDVKGSFHAGTADFLQLSDGGIFQASPSANSVLTVAPPSSFGFLGSNPAGISIQKSSLVVPSGKTLSVVGGDIQITGGFDPWTFINSAGGLLAPGGKIAVASVASPGEVGLVDFGTDGFTKWGTISLQNAYFKVEGGNISSDPAGTILLRGGQLFFHGSLIAARGNPGGGLIIRGEQLHMADTWINTGTRGSVDHPGVGVDVNVTGEMALTNGTEIASSGFGPGRAGDVRIVADTIVLGDDDPTNSPYSGNGFYGDLGSRAFGPGRGGNVDITSESLTVRNGFFIDTEALSSGDAGNVTIRTGSLKALDGGYIASLGLGTGSGGMIDISAGDVLLSDRNRIDVPNLRGGAGIFAQAGYGSKGGAIRLTANNLEILDGAHIDTRLFSIGPGGDIDINAKNITVSGVVTDNRNAVPDVHAAIDASVIGSYATGTGGNIRVVSDSLKIGNGGYISSGLFNDAPGNAGSVAVQAGSIEVSNAGGIFASSLYGTGDAGNLEISAGEIRIVGPQSSSDPFGKDFTGFSTSTKSGQGGDLRVTTDSLLLTNRGSIASASFGSGSSGNITVHAGNVELLNGSNLLASAFDTGSGGNIEVTAEKMTVSGVHPEVFTGITGTEMLSPSAIGSQSVAKGGNAGDIRIATGALSLLDGGRVSTETSGPGTGGNIFVQTDSILVAGFNTALGEFLVVQDIDPKFAGSAILSASFGNPDSTVAAGPAGEIRISARSVTLRDRGLISSETDASGAGGKIGIASDTVALSGGASISAMSSGVGEAGSISIQASNTFESRNGYVTTEATQADGGNIDLKVGYMVNLANSEITSSVNGGPGTVGGNITVDPEFVVLQGSRIVANAFEGTGGNIRITTGTYLSDPGSMVDASSALGIDGMVDIQAPVTDIAGGLKPLGKNYLNAAELLGSHCAARMAGKNSSSFVVGGREGLPAEPGQFLPSPLYTPGPAQGQRDRSEGQ